MIDGKKNEKTYSVTEVGTLVESVRNDISVIAEDLSSVKKDVSLLKTDMAEVKVRLITIEDGVRIAIPSLTRRVSAIEAKVGV